VGKAEHDAGVEGILPVSMHPNTYENKPDLSNEHQVLSEAADVDLIYATDSKGMTCLDLALRGAFGESCPMVSQVIWGMRQCGRNGRHFLALGLG